MLCSRRNAAAANAFGNVAQQHFRILSESLVSAQLIGGLKPKTGSPFTAPARPGQGRERPQGWDGLVSPFQPRGWARTLAA